MPKVTLRCCASCEWIYEGNVDCPKCGFGSYSAHYVYGKKAYKFKVTQEPWLEKKVEAYRSKLWSEHIKELKDARI
jgi:hypothetical protein